MNKKKLQPYNANYISYLFHLRHLQNIQKRKPKFPFSTPNQVKQKEKEEERELRLKINNNQKLISQIKMKIKNCEMSKDPIDNQILQIQKDNVVILTEETQQLQMHLKRLKQGSNSMLAVGNRNNRKVTLPKINSS